MLLSLAMVLGGCGNSDNGGKQVRKPVLTPKKQEVPANPKDTKGVGPISHVELSADIDPVMVEKGKEIFDAMCTACHKADKKHIGPAPVGILERRSPEWVMNMILNPTEMVQKDPLAKQLLMEFNGSPMADQNLTEEQARQVLEYFRTLK